MFWSVPTHFKRDLEDQGLFKVRIHITPLKTNMTLKHLVFSIGNTSSNLGFSLDMLVFGGVSYIIRF